MPSSQRAPITIVAGETMGHVYFGLWEPPVDPLAEPTEALDLAGCTARLTVREYSGAATSILDLSTGAASLTIDENNIIPVLSAATSALLTPGTYWYELAVTFADGEREVTHYGEFTVEPLTVAVS